MNVPQLSSVRAELMRRSLYRFLEGAWHVLEPSVPLTPGWHLEFVAAHLQALVTREPGSALPTNLCINIPPGTMKSMLTSVFLPAWVWLTRPSWRAIFASANPRVSLRDSMRCRDLLESQWYRETFDIKWSLADDQNAKSAYKNTGGGSRLAIGVGAKITGDRADALFIDDPHDAAEVYSKTQRESVLYWYDNAFANRVNSPSDSTRCLIMQRLHEEDLTAHVLKQGWAHICLPMEYETPRDGVEAKPKTFLGRVDPREREGELLMPARFPSEVVNAEKIRLGSAGTAGQLQQRPVAAVGNKFLREWWRFYSPTGAQGRRFEGASQVPPQVMNPAAAHFDEVLGSVDAAFKGTETSDFVVGVVVGVIGAQRFILARYRGRMGLGKTLDMIRQMRRDWPNTHRILVEDKANGSAIVEVLQSEITGVIAVQPEGGKEARAAALEPEVEAGNWLLPDGAEWLGEWADEFASFPLGAHDDQVDACSQACIKLKLMGDAAYTALLLSIPRR